MSFQIYLRLRDTCASMSVWLIFIILTLQFSKGDGESTVTVRLYPTEKYVASVGERVAFSCLVTGHLREGGPMVHVFWKHLGKTVKSCQFPPTLHRDGFSEYCNYTIVANGTAMQHRYLCTLFYLGTRTKTLLLEIAEPEATIDVRDLFTGNLFDRDSEPICSQLGSTRTFECTVRYAQPGIWDISWIIDGQPVVTGSVETGTGGLVNVSSRFRLPQSSAGFTENLTCQAAGADRQLLNRTVQLKACLVPDTTVDVRDLLTGNLVDSRPICVQPGFARSFECTVRDAQPGIWGISWIIDGQPVVTDSVETGTGGLVNVSSIINLSYSPTELLKNLTCQGAGVDDRQLLSRTVKFHACQDVHLNPSIDLRDVSAGFLVGLTSESVCIQPGTDRCFQCTIRDVLPGPWNVTWIVDGEVVGARITNATGIANGLVNVSSMFTLSKWQNDGTRKSLTCRATGVLAEPLNVTVYFDICSVVNATIQLVDLANGRLVDTNSKPICLKAGTKRTFACTVLDITPDVVMTWIIDDSRNETRQVDVMPTADGLVNMNSSFTVFNSQEQGPISSLTCLAAGFKTEPLLHITVQLRSCSGVIVNQPPRLNDSSSLLNASMDLVDLSTGESVDGSSGPICVPSGTGRAFGCTIQQVITNEWGIIWVLDGAREESSPVVQMPSTAGRVDLFSSFTVSNRQGETFIKSLTCQATGQRGEELAITVELRDCSDSETASTLNMTILFVVVGVLSGMLVTAVAALVLCAKRSRKNEEVRTSAQMKSNVDESVEMESVIGDSGPDGTSPEDEVTYQNTLAQQHAIPDEESKDSGLPSWAQGWGIPWSDFFVDERVLGSGNFGEVRSGAVRKDGEVTRAAIKMLKGYASACDRDDFMDELRTMACIGYHPNIVLLLGACQHHDVLHVALEYLPYGDLRSYLRTARSQSDSDEDALSSEQLVMFALDVAKGMEHLSKAGVIHRDLAARNILLGDRLIAKVSDFGLSRGKDIYVQTSRRRVPLRWLAIESLRHQLYTSQSDVWSFGILLWEIATFGGSPYPSIPNDSLAETIKRGYRMPQPDNCHDHIYALMRECWDEEPDNRPTFTELVYILSDMADSRIKHTYMAVIRNDYENACVFRPELDDS